jgi:hypothetical protein
MPQPEPGADDAAADHGYIQHIASPIHRARQCRAAFFCFFRQRIPTFRLCAGQSGRILLFSIPQMRFYYNFYFLAFG